MPDLSIPDLWIGIFCAYPVGLLVGIYLGMIAPPGIREMLGIKQR